MASLVLGLALRLLTRCEADETSSFFVLDFLGWNGYMGSEEFIEWYRYGIDRIARDRATART